MYNRCCQDARTGILAESDHGSGSVSGVRIAGIASVVRRRGALPKVRRSFSGWRSAQDRPEPRRSDPPRRFGHGLHLGPVFRGGKPTDAGTPLVAGRDRRSDLRHSDAGLSVPGHQPCAASRLGLPSSCYAFDVNLGCSDTLRLVDGGELMQNVKGNVLLLVGDTISGSRPRRSIRRLLFGDAGTATALAPDADAPPDILRVGRRRIRVRHLIVRAGGFRNPSTPESAIRTLREGQNIRSDQDMFMDGAEIFAFALQRVPPLVKAVLQNARREMDEIDGFVFHQANRFMLEHLAKRIGFRPASCHCAGGLRNTVPRPYRWPLAARDFARGFRSPACDCSWRASGSDSRGPR